VIRLEKLIDVKQINVNEVKLNIE